MNARVAEVKQEMTEMGIMKAECPVQMDDLALLEVPYKNFEGEVKKGEILVLRALQEEVKNIFTRLLEVDFRIHNISLINDFDGDDGKSMEANNSSSFNCRAIAGTNKYSKHSYGVAIDINPLQNPFVSEDGAVSPKGGEKFLERDDAHMGMVTPEVVKIFADNKFSIWGGDWDSIKDYHHFEVSDEMIAFLFGDVC